MKKIILGFILCLLSVTLMKGSIEVTNFINNDTKVVDLKSESDDKGRDNPGGVVLI